MDDLTIRPATPADAAVMADLYNQAVETSTATFDTQRDTAEAREAWLARHTDPRHPVLVAERGGRVVGWSSLSRYSDRIAYDATVELSTYLDREATGQGLGRRLTEAVLEAGRRGGVHAVLGRVCTENAVSLALARQLGFFEVGVMREVGVKFGRTLDVVLLEKIL